MLQSVLPRFTHRFESHYGYAPGSNALVGGSGSPFDELETEAFVELPPDARHFFTTYGGVSLPDLWNGVFLGPTAWIVRMSTELRAVETTGEAVPITAVGSDGGGGYFVLDRRDPGPIAHLGVGALRDGLLSLQTASAENSTLAAHVVAATFLDLLTRIVDSVGRASDGDNRNPFA